MSELVCTDERRREDVRQAALYGLDFVEVGDDQLSLEVFFLGKAPPAIEIANVIITGGRRIRGIRVTDVRVQRQEDPAFDDTLEVRVDRFGDFSTYTLSLVHVDEAGRPTGEVLGGFDPRYSKVDFTFKAGCPTDLDCQPQPDCPPALRPEPDINYLAKDYASFRQLILDRLALTIPDWRERHVPDIQIALVELLAYVGDYLSYYQDAVATEAYLGTARQRISVRRHARLVDYPMHEGCTARAFVTIGTDSDATLDPAHVFFCTRFPAAGDRFVLQPADMRDVAPTSYTALEIVQTHADAGRPIPIYRNHTEIHFYTWGDCECCLAQGSTSATLVDSWVPTPHGEDAAMDGPPNRVRALQLKVGEVLIFEEVVGPRTGNPADADPRHRQAVRLTSVSPTVDPLYHPYGANYGQPIVEIEWCSEDALSFPLCISAKMPAPDCTCRDNLSVARGNVVLVDNSTPIVEPLGSVPTAQTQEQCPTDCDPGGVIVSPGPFKPSLKNRPLTFSQALPAGGCASTMIPQDPRLALPRVSLTGTLATPQGPLVTAWTARQDLLESGPNDRDFVVELDDSGYAHVRFGNGQQGRMPDAGTLFEAAYGVGNGPDGNVGAETITVLVFRQTTEGVGRLAPRNPLPATGGTAAEPVEQVKLLAPQAFRGKLERAITAADYASIGSDNSRRLTERHDVLPFRRLQGAKSTLRWTGSWYQAQVAVDPSGTEDTDAALLFEITDYLEPYRRIGHDLRVNPAIYVPVDLALSVCVQPHFLRAHVESELLAIFSTRRLPDGSLGFFHPDNLTFGEGIFVSRIVAAAQAVPGVMEIHVTRLERYEIGEPPPGHEAASEELPHGSVLTLGPFEIARLDNDPSFPEHGRLVLDVTGGR